VDIDQQLALVNVDRAKIQHVLFALAQNGLEAAASGTSPPQVRISTVSDQRGVETSVVDSGPGVPAGARNRLFKPFYSTKRGGVGLGLASARAIVDMHEGSIGFENLSRGGCRFWFRLPAC